MSCENLQGLRLLGVEKKVHPFLVVRLVELEALLDNLLNENIINPKNLQDGLIADLCTGSGADLLAIRRKTLAPIFGVDNKDKVPHVEDWGGEGINHYCGAGLKCPEKGVLDVSATSFVKEDVVTFLSTRSYNTYSFMTLFYIGGIPIDYQNLLDQCGLVFRPGGQLLITSDKKIDELSRDGNSYVKEWGTMTEDVQWGGRTLPVRSGLIDRLGGLENLHNYCKDYFMKKDLKTENGTFTIRNVRDQSYWVFTKTN